MGVFLVGGGWDDTSALEVLGGFVEAARGRATGRAPRVRLVVIGTDVAAREYHQRYLETFAVVGLRDVLVERVREGSPCPASALEDIDALFVGGGPTPAYHSSLEPLYPAIRDLVADGVPYAGFSAGAQITGSTAVVGGWRLDGVPVCPEDSSEDLEELTVVAGVGLLAGAVEVHTAQWGNLSRLVAAVGAGLVPYGVAIDECTTLEAATGTVTGAGRTWQVTQEGAGVVVRRG